MTRRTKTSQPSPPHSDLPSVVEWEIVDGALKPVQYVRHPDKGWVHAVSLGLRPLTWAPQKGSQEVFLNLTEPEVVYEGTRGPGKTDALLFDFLRDLDKGWGADWKGVLFRRTYPELQDVIDKSKKWIPLIWPGAKFNESKTQWVWPTGEKLLFRQFQKESDYWKFHGHAYPWIGWEELTTWPDDKCYKSMFSCSRSTRQGMPKRIRSTTNPYGIGHNWVKLRFRLPIVGNDPLGPLIDDSRDSDGELEPARRAVHGDLRENRLLLHADPAYINRLRAAARNEAELQAWIYGSWDIVAGGMFDDVWRPAVHVLPNIPFHLIPRGWRIDRSYDHGSSRPFSVGWWAESNGEPITVEGRRIGEVRGDLIRISEWYGWNGKPNEGVKMLASDIGQGIVDRETDWGIRGRVQEGPADSAIFDDYQPGSSVAGDMSSAGVDWDAADKGPGSRIQGWEQVRSRLKAAIPVVGVGREKPGLFVTKRCTQFLRTIPVLPRDGKNLDDVDSDAEDHIGDEVRYRVRHVPNIMQKGRFK